MDVKIILKKLAEINKKANKDHTHEDLNNEILMLKEKINKLEEVTNNLLYFEEIQLRK